MIPEKEVLKELETIAKRQTRIFNDACDYGIPADTNLKRKLRKLCRAIGQVYKSTSDISKYTKTWSCFIPYEHEFEAYQGVKVTVSLNMTKKCDYFTIDFERASQTTNPFKELAYA